MSAKEKTGWVVAIALTLIIEAVLIAFAYETGIVDALKRMLFP